jgi:hypothetical protein
MANSLRRASVVAILAFSMWVLAMPAGAQAGSEGISHYGFSGSEHDIKLVNGWCKVHLPGIYAGLYYSSKGGGRLVIGFTKSQPQHLRQVRQLDGLITPKHIVAFSVTPTYSRRELQAFSKRIANAALRRADFEGLVNAVGENVARNVVTVDTEHVHRVRQLLAERYGQNVPILVEFSAPPVEI